MSTLLKLPLRIKRVVISKAATTKTKRPTSACSRFASIRILDDPREVARGWTPPKCRGVYHGKQNPPDKPGNICPVLALLARRWNVPRQHLQIINFPRQFRFRHA